MSEQTVASPYRKTVLPTNVHLLSLDFSGLTMNWNKKSSLSKDRSSGSIVVARLAVKLEALAITLDHHKELLLWRREVLNEGPRLKALSNLQRLLIDSSPDGLLEECSIISSCIRLDVVCVARKDASPDDVRHHITQVLLSQARYFCEQYSKAKAFVKKARGGKEPRTTFSLLGDGTWDRPWLIFDHVDLKLVQPSPATWKALWEHPTADDDDAILYHLFQTTAGIKHVNVGSEAVPKDKRGFRPDDAGDAHIMYQINRTMNIVSISSTKEGRSFSILEPILKASVRVGKACRNEKILPDIAALPGTESDLNAAIEAAFTKVIEPAMEKCSRELVAKCKMLR